MSKSRSFGDIGYGAPLAQMVPCANRCGYWHVIAVGSIPWRDQPVCWRCKAKEEGS